MELPTTTDQFQFLARKRYVKRVKKIAFIFLDYNALSDSWEDFLFFSFFKAGIPPRGMNRMERRKRLNFFPQR